MTCERCRGRMLYDRLLRESSCLSCGWTPDNQPSEWALQIQESGQRPARIALPEHPPSPPKYPMTTREELLYRKRLGVQMQLRYLEAK